MIFLKPGQPTSVFDNQGPRAFTLIEVLVVVAIIVLLIAILIPSLTEARRQAQIVSCATNLRTIGHALIYYVEENDDYLPESSAGGFENLHKYIQKVSKSSKDLKINTQIATQAPFADVEWYMCPGDEIYHITNQVEHKMPDGTKIKIQYRLSYGMNNDLSYTEWPRPDGTGVNSPKECVSRRMSSVKRPGEMVSYCGAGNDDVFGADRWVLNESNDKDSQTEFEVHHKKGNNFLYCDTHVLFKKITWTPPQYGLPPFPQAWIPNWKLGYEDGAYDDFVREEPVPRLPWP
ncbi:MAG: prepilin-type N-terminal cleavage/methylation domain-containing protein [Planctomycetota bacterium]